MQDHEFDQKSRKAHEHIGKAALIPGDPFPWEPDPSPSNGPVEDPTPEGDLEDPSWIDLGGGD